MRESGILLHISSLPGPWGIGTMGSLAFSFVDFLKKAGQSYWQILPLTPTGYGDSPYQSCSTYAGNHYLIDLDQLVAQNLLTVQDLESNNWFETETSVDFGQQYRLKMSVLRLAFARFSDFEALDEFCSKADFVFSFAGVNRPKEQNEFMEGNRDFTAELLSMLKKHGNLCPVMYASSVQASLTGRYAGRLL